VESSTHVHSAAALDPGCLESRAAGVDPFDVERSTAVRALQDGNVNAPLAQACRELRERVPHGRRRAALCSTRARACIRRLTAGSCAQRLSRSSADGRPSSFGASERSATRRQCCTDHQQPDCARCPRELQLASAHSAISA
jgi:hypothetical protein